MAEDHSQDDRAQAQELDARAAQVLDEMRMGAAAPNPCDTWRRIRSIVVAASNLKLIPANIRQVLKQVIEIADGFCPSS
ncbi:MAG TPA: hypothetical protein VF771_07815 [Longimicrobiaceae bacterium]